MKVRTGTQDKFWSRLSGDAPWFVLGAAGILVLLWMCRGAPLGTAVIDDYVYLERLRFHHPLDLLDSMGAPWYWRPISRQLYFLGVGPWLLAAPWGVVTLHVVLVLALYALLFSIARRGFPAPSAAAIASFPLLSEPMRVLLVWPSGDEYLLPMLGVTLAVQQTLAGRKLGAGLGLLIGMLSHELAALALPVVPLIAWFRERRLRPAAEWGALAGGVGGVWALARLVTRARGVALPSHPSGSLPWGEQPVLLTRGIVAQLNLEDFSGMKLATLAILNLVFLGVALVLAMRRETRERLRASGPVLIGSAVWFLVMTFPLSYVQPVWNGWRSMFPSLGLAFLLPGLLGLVSPLLMGGWVLLRIAALVLAAPGPALVTSELPPTTSHLSFVRLVRLERIVGSTHRALLERFPHLPSGAAVRFSGLPLLSEWAFQGSRAVRVWYGDTTLSWSGLGGEAGLGRRVDALVVYNPSTAEPAVVIEPEALRLFREARDALSAGRLESGDSLLTGVLRSQPRFARLFSASVARTQSNVALTRGDVARADSLNRLDLEWGGENATAYLIRARIAAARNDLPSVIPALQRCLALDPQNAEAFALARSLGLVVQPAR